jgi:hypothetical protein
MVARQYPQCHGHSTPNGRRFKTDGLPLKLRKLVASDYEVGREQILSR